MRMSNQEAIEVIKLAQAQVEWEYPMDYAVAFDMAISALQAQESPKPTAESVQNVKDDDLVSRKAAIEALAKHEKSNGHNYTLFVDIVSECAEIIRDLPSAQPEPQWIPVSERLPEANGRYLVTRGLNACGAMWNRVYIINYSDLMGLKSERIWWDGNVGKSDFERIDDVIAWQPLPEPYRAERRTDG